MENEDKNLFNQAISEITQLRNQNAIMSAKLEMFDSMMLIFNTQPNWGSKGMSEDLIWKIERHLKDNE